MKTLKDKHMPEKYAKFHKHRHKKNNWISYGILRSIKFRGNLYMKYKQCKPNSLSLYIYMYNRHKKNLSVFNGILKRTIRKANIRHYEKVFHRYRRDMKMTWEIISEVVFKSDSKRNEIEVDKITVTDKISICNEYNSFFTSMEPKLAGKINTQNKKCDQTYLKLAISRICFWLSWWVLFLNKNIDGLVSPVHIGNIPI